MYTLSSKKLILGALKSIITPFSSFKRIDESSKINYRLVVPFMVLWGALFIILTFGLAQRNWIFEYGHAWYALIGCALYSIGLWLLGTVGLYLLSKVFRKRVSIHKIEISVFYLWLVWALMPIFDTPHLVFNIPMWDVLGVSAHLSWFFAFPVLAISSFFVLKDVLGLRKWQLVFAIIMALAVPFIGRFFLEQIPIYLSPILGINYFPCSILVASLGSIVLLGIRFGVTRKWSLRRVCALTVTSALLVTTVWSTLAALSIFDFKMSEDEYTGYVTTGFFGIGFSWPPGGTVWYSGDYEGSSLRNPASGNGNDNDDSYYSNTYSNVVDMDYNPYAKRINGIKLIVHTTSTLNNGQSGAGPKCQACFAGGTGTTYCSAWQTNLADGVSANYSFYINASSIYTYSASADGSSAGASGWATLVSQMTQNDNDLIVHQWCQGDGDGSGASGDVFAWDQLWVEVDYDSGIYDTPSTYNFGSVYMGQTYSTGLTTFNLTNYSGYTINVSISGTDMTGGTAWTLSDTAAQGTDIYGLKAGLEGGSYSIVVKKSATYNNLVTNMAGRGYQNWGLQLLAPTGFSDATAKSGTVTLTIVVP